MRKKSLAPAHLHAGPNMTPLVDIVMVILIFLMLAGSFGTQEHVLESKLPIQDGHGRGPSDRPVFETPTRLDIHVSRSTGGFDVFNIGGETVSGNDALTGKLRERHAQYAAAGTADDVEVIIHPTGDTAWEPVIGSYDAALRAEFKKVHFAVTR